MITIGSERAPSIGYQASCGIWREIPQTPHPELGFVLVPESLQDEERRRWITADLDLLPQETDAGNERVFLVTRPQWLKYMEPDNLKPSKGPVNPIH